MKNRAKPVLVLGSEHRVSSAGRLEGKVTVISVGSIHTVALLNDSSVVSWGQNDYGQLGDGTTINRSVPVPVVGLKGKVVAIAAGEYHTVVLLSNGSVVSWGRNNSGQLGDGTTKDRAEPVLVKGLKEGVIAISAGEQHTSAFLKDGSVWAWGRNNEGQLGDGTRENRTEPVPVILTDGGLLRACFNPQSGRSPGLLALERAQRALTANDTGL